MFTIGKSLS